MRNSILSIIAVFLLSISSSFAQEQKTQVSAGIRGGVNLSTLQHKNLENNKYAPGFNIAIPVEVSLHKNFAIQPEFHFIQKGVAFDISNGEVEKKERNFTNYLELPILFKGIVGNEVISGYVFAAPTFGYAYDRYNVMVTDGERDRNTAGFTKEGEIQDNRFDFGASFGLGTELQAGPGKVVIDARYGLDFNDNYKFENDKPENYEGTYNSGIALTVGYMMPLGM
ncbi:porin family protein [Xanthovirga aplysinae]|uniref:porin family protein n=1 Tax=Xanthovirga aplysinae TaxID=2529853 RepID=UPI0012BB64BC|nr:porin family protein [Xanthovirga aplysinae]MTI32721.1 PorT family protein [Xanthovirga aplysinae]